MGSKRDDRAAYSGDTPKRKHRSLPEDAEVAETAADGEGSKRRKHRHHHKHHRHRSHRHRSSRSEKRGKEEVSEEVESEVLPSSPGADSAKDLAVIHCPPRVLETAVTIAVELDDREEGEILEEEAAAGAKSGNGEPSPEASEFLPDQGQVKEEHDHLNDDRSERMLERETHLMPEENGFHGLREEELERETQSRSPISGESHGSLKEKARDIVGDDDISERNSKRHRIEDHDTIGRRRGNHDRYRDKYGGETDRERDRGNAREGGREKSRGSSRDRERGTSQERGREKSRDSSRDRDRYRDAARDRDRKRSRDSSRDRGTSLERNWEKSRGSSRDRDRYRDTAQDGDREKLKVGRERERNRDSAQDRDQERLRDASRDRERGTSRERDWEKSRGSSRDRERDRDTARDRDREKSMDLSRDRERYINAARERDREKSRESSRDRERYSSTRERDQEKSRDSSRDRERGRSAAQERDREKSRDPSRDRERDRYREREREISREKSRMRSRSRERERNGISSKYNDRDRHREVGSYERREDSRQKDSRAKEEERREEHEDDYEEKIEQKLAEQEEEDPEKIMEESRRRRLAILEKYKQKQEQLEQHPKVPVFEHKEEEEKVMSAVFSVEKSPQGNDTQIDMPALGGLGAGTPKGECSGDMFSDDIFGESPTGVRKLEKGDDLKVSKSGLHDNWDDAEGYYAYRFGEVLDGRYEVIASHGKGVFSIVVRAKDLKAGSGDPKEVAIKIIRNNETMYKAGMEELIILKKLVGADPEDRRHCVRFLSSFKYRNHLCLVFESLHMNLREVLKKFGRNIGLKLTAVRAYAKQLFIALKHLRNCGVLHCDIKPDNMLVNEAKNVLKLCDFGNAMFAGKNEITPYLVSRFYRAPEIILGLPYDHPMDIWSVGCCLYELYAGKVLFPGPTNNDMLRLHMELKGPFPKKMLRKGAFVDHHFDQDLNFHATEEDPVTKKTIKRILLNIKPKDFNALLSTFPGEDPKLLAHFKDLLERIFVLDPEKRMTVAQALSHPFITGK